MAFYNFLRTIGTLIFVTFSSFVIYIYISHSIGLSTWEKTFNNPKAREKAYNSPNGPWKAALLSGPPGSYT